MRPKLLIVDGFNVLRSGPAYASLQARMPDYGDEYLNTTREALIDDARILAGHDYDVLVVFDGGGNVWSEGRSEVSGGVEVIFSEHGVSADSVIEERAKHAVAAGREVLVVTSDATMQWTVLGDAVTRMSAASFCSEVAGLKAEITSDEKLVNPRMTLGERLDAETLRKLRALVQGHD